METDTAEPFIVSLELIRIGLPTSAVTLSASPQCGTSRP